MNRGSQSCRTPSSMASPHRWARLVSCIKAILTVSSLCGAAVLSSFQYLTFFLDLQQRTTINFRRTASSPSFLVPAGRHTTMHRTGLPTPRSREQQVNRHRTCILLQVLTQQLNRTMETHLVKVKPTLTILRKKGECRLRSDD
jgi:hypothetical protein